LEYWNSIYRHFNPIAIDFGFISVHWYGIMYVLALLTALWFAKWIIKNDNIDIEEELLDRYFIWIEIGIIVGARVWYILFYDPNTSYYLLRPWEIFNPFHNGEFIGIRGMSYHGAVVGAIISSYLFYRKYPDKLSKIVDIVALAIPVGYIFGRVGNFLNKELIGRATDMPWGIYVDGVLRHPSQLYEALLEGALVAIVLFLYRKKKKFNGELIALYGILYSVMRFICEFWREPDPQLGFLYGNWLTMGQIQSFIMFIFSIGVYIFIKNRN
jgi:phosphatidylglycerol:prolipoprotein diacylglycerol transferase